MGREREKERDGEIAVKDICYSPHTTLATSTGTMLERRWSGGMEYLGGGHLGGDLM